VASGRYHRGSDVYLEHEAWAALYLACGRDVALAEVVRHLSPTLWRRLATYRLTEVRVELAAVLDCRDPEPLGLTADDLLHDTDYGVTQALGAAVLALGLEGLLVPSATRLGDNLVVFPTNRRGRSSLVAGSYVDPRLLVERPIPERSIGDDFG
jgi:hypothetical protein